MRTHAAVVATAALVALCCTAPGSLAQQPKPPGQMTPAELRELMARNPAMFLKAARAAQKWDEPAEPLKIAGPIHFVGTQGLAVWLITGSEGDILMNTGMPGSGPMIEASIRKLGLDPRRIRWLLTCHTHVDHVGGHAYLKKLTGARVAVAAQEVGLLESGGKGQFNYDGVPGFDHEPVMADRVLRDGDVVKLGDLALTAHLTPGHNFGDITWTMEITEGGKAYSVVFPDGSGVNPGYRILHEPSYPGIERDYRNTLHFLATLKPDIWLHAHTDAMAFGAKRARAAATGAQAWVDPDGYRRWVAAESASFESIVEAEANAASKKGANP